MKDIKQINIFISCPGDITDELNSIELIVKEINKTFGELNGFALRIVHWSEDTYTDIGEDGQEIINNQIEYDILVGILWMRLGTPTKRDKSGTVEEINRAIVNPNKQQLIYFKTTSPNNINAINTSDLNEIRIFKKELSDKLLYKEFESVEKFETLFRLNLSNLIKDKFLLKKEKQFDNNDSSNSVEIVSSKKVSKYQNIISLIDEIENPNQESLIDVDIFDLTETSFEYFEKVTMNLENLTNYITKLTGRLNSSTEEINRTNNIKDTRLKISKAKKIINQLSEELNEFISSLNSFNSSDNLKEVGKKVSEVLLTIKSYKDENYLDIKSNTIDYRNSMEYAMNSTANMLKEIMLWPPVNLKFNTTKRNTEIVLKDLTKEIMFGLTLIDESIEE